MFLERNDSRVRETPDAQVPGRRHIVPVETHLRVIEAYLPEANTRDDDWYLRLRDRAGESLAPFGLKVALLVLPEDETALWLISAAGHAAARILLPPELDLPGLIGAATAFAGGHVMERQMAARIVQDEDPAG
jgi:hypothetical protein